MAYIHGQDWSSYQSSTPSTSGLDFVIVKATEGTGYVNPRMKSQAAHARKAGLVLGFYHFLRPGDMKKQAAYFVDRADSREGDLLVADWEDPGVSNSDKDAFIKEVIRLRGKTHRVGLYCNTNYWLNRDNTSYCGDFLWVAHYGVSAGKPGVEHRWTLHQYTDKPVDKNVARFSSRAAMREWADKGGDSPATPKPSGASQAAKVVSVAKAEVGYREGRNNYQKYSPNVPNLAWSQNQPWCQTFQAWVAIKAGTAAIEPRTASCRVAADWFKARKQFSYYPAIGAHVFFGPGGGTHVGRVYRYDATYVWTIEGNTNTDGSAEGNGVYLKKRRRRDSYLYGYGMPAFAEGVTTADPSLKGKGGYMYKATATAPATTVTTTPNTLMEEAEAMSAKELNAAMWDMDNLPAPPSANTYDQNKTWKASSYLKEQYERTHELKDDVSALSAKVDALSAKVDALDLEGFASALESLRIRIDVAGEGE